MANFTRHFKEAVKTYRSVKISGCIVTVGAAHRILEYLATLPPAERSRFHNQSLIKQVDEVLHT